MRVGLIRIAVVAAVLLLAYGRMLADAPGGSWVIEGLTADSVKRVLGMRSEEHTSELQSQR